jgi:iron complex transport system substrate-binding protein
MPAILEGPRRIICLTEETVETLYLLGEDERIVGVSGYAVRPKEARQKPRVSAFTSAKIDKILALEPDLVLGFSDLQADIARDLIRAGANVLVFNQRSIEEILQMIATLARIVNAEARGVALIERLQRNLDAIAAEASKRAHRPRVFFEEWPDPLISGIRWVEELIEIAGGAPIFPELRREQSAGGRIVEPGAVAGRNPEVILASWCGKKVNEEAIRQRPGWSQVAAVVDNRIHEIKSTYILQPGPAALTDGVAQIHKALQWEHAREG